MGFPALSLPTLYPWHRISLDLELSVCRSGCLSITESPSQFQGYRNIHHIQLFCQDHGSESGPHTCVTSTLIHWANGFLLYFLIFFSYLSWKNHCTQELTAIVTMHKTYKIKPTKLQRGLRSIPQSLLHTQRITCKGWLLVGKRVSFLQESGPWEITHALVSRLLKLKVGTHALVGTFSMFPKTRTYGSTGWTQWVLRQSLWTGAWGIGEALEGGKWMLSLIKTSI